MYLVVDNDRDSLAALKEGVYEAYSDISVAAFQDPMLAFQYAFNHSVDVAFVAVKMKRLNGFELLKMLRKLNPDIQIILVDSDEDCRVDAMRVSADGFIVRPVTPDKIRSTENMEF